MDLLRPCELNQFLLVEVIENKLSGYTEAATDQILLDFSGQIHFLKLNEKEQSVLLQNKADNHISSRKDDKKAQSNVNDEAILSETEEINGD